MTKVIVYHDSAVQARRARRPKTGETIAYRSKKNWDAKENEKFDEVIDLSTPKKKTAKVTDKNDVQL